jgi:site-specific DNA-methyltransferase (adenine-specific)
MNQYINDNDDNTINITNIQDNSIHNDDCFQILPKIDNKSVDLVLVDLPYGQMDCEWDIKIDLDMMWKELKRICKDNCQYVFFTTTKFGNELINSNSKWFRYDFVWEKYNPVGFLNANKMPLRIHEMIYIFNNCYFKKHTYLLLKK